MAKSVITIPATKKKNTGDSADSWKRRRVAAYARVSTDHEEQQSSYEAQVDYYTEYIKRRADWEFVCVYADEGITGCNTRKREGFNQMVADALNGRIDLIITKSVSRFARNTVDSLTTIRRLKEHGVECYFEKENIWTLDGKGELLLTIMSSLAQEESRSISQNCTWGQRKRFADGKVSVPFGRFLGYDRGEDGNLILNEQQAVVVRRIYGLFLQGRSPYAIAKVLTHEGIPSPGGKGVWAQSTVRSILCNEKYKGDALLQKVYTVDFLSKKKKVNEGEIPQYYVEGNHEAIISPAVFDQVQRQMQQRRQERKRQSCAGVFSGRIKCGSCGGWYGPKVWHSNDKYRKVVWQCNDKFQGGETCPTPHLDEKMLKRLFVRAVNLIFSGREEVMERYRILLENVRGVLREQVDQFLAQLEQLDGIYTQFDQDSWYALVESVTVFHREDIRFVFKNGKEVRLQDTE
ncbi:MAG: recombinase family protein [Lachnospiraceae bacterium]|nr:recombinase family protein [Lachnospiraceae bacterium]